MEYDDHFKNSNHSENDDTLNLEYRMLELKFSKQQQNGICPLDKASYERMIIPHLKVFAHNNKSRHDQRKSQKRNFPKKKVLLIDVENSGDFPVKNSHESCWKQQFFADLTVKEKEIQFYFELRERAKALFRRKKINKVKSDENSFPAITEEMMLLVKNALHNPLHQVLVTHERQAVRRSDLETLCSLNWLNDTIINMYMTLIMNRSKAKAELPKVFAFNSYFLPRFVDSGYKSIRRWTKNVDIFQFDIILVPVHLGMHWCMSVIDLRSKIIKYMDSLGSKNNTCLHTLLDYLGEEMQDKKQMSFDHGAWKLANVQGLPQQENGSDCGMFALKYADYTAKNRPITFKQSDMPYFRRRMMIEILKGTLLDVD